MSEFDVKPTQPGPFRSESSQQTTGGGTQTAPAIAPGAPASPASGHQSADSSMAASVLSHWGECGDARPLPPGLQQKFGQSLGADLSAVRIHTGAEAAAKAASHGAQAVTHGRDIFFGKGQYAPESAEGQHILAHEIAHTVQQSGQAPSMQARKEKTATAESAEVEAETAAAAMLAGKPAAVSSGSGLRTQPYTPMTPGTAKPGQWDAGRPLRVADDGLLAVGSSGPSAYGGSHDCWAEAGLVASANAKLKSIQSVIQLRPAGSDLTGDAPDGSGSKTLTKVEPENTSTKTFGNAMEIWADCGRSGRDVMGAGEGTGQHYERMTAGYNKENPPGLFSRLWALVRGAPAPGPTVEHRDTAASSPGGMKDEMLMDLLGASTPDEAFQEYQAMAPAEREKFDEKAGINRHAAPGVGEGFTMSTGGNPVPGHENQTWNFHWGGVVLVSGGDRVTLENYAVGDPNAKNTDWLFQMYGPASKAGQTFHDQHKATEQHGDSPTTLAVHKR